jgi:hypothetical protein
MHQWPAQLVDARPIGLLVLSAAVSMHLSKMQSNTIVLTFAVYNPGHCAQKLLIRAEKFRQATAAVAAKWAISNCGRR